MLLTENMVTVVGWLGVVICTLGFLLLNMRILKFDAIAYQLINMLGGICLVTSAIYFGDKPNIAANSLWIVIAVYGLFRGKKGKKDPA